MMPDRPTPATMPGAGLSHVEALRRLAAEQGIGPVTDPDEPASPEPLPAAEAEAFIAATHEPSSSPPQPAPAPHPPRYTMPLILRDQHIRRLGLELAITHYQDLEVELDELLDTARHFARWIRSGQLPTTTTTDDNTDQHQEQQ